jgi:ketosteroid isomerase-like protein
MDYQAIIRKLYSAFNNRNIDAVFEYMHEDVDWPNGWEGGYIKGKDEVRAYWTRQWNEINPQVTPIAVEEQPDGQIKVLVQQLVKDHRGNVLVDEKVIHTYSFEGGKVKRMQIEKERTV